jgi:hypothetical protein
MWVAAALSLGCHARTVPQGTGAEEAARDFFEALSRGDLPLAYGLLHPDSTRQLTADRFVELATQYRRNIGFEPDAVHIRSCEERDTDAVAHIVLTGTGGARYSFKDAVSLRRAEAEWRILLPPRFGQSRRR